MSGLVESILNVNALLACTIVGVLVFGEDALFVGFVLPGETAAVLGGVVVSRGGAAVFLGRFIAFFRAVMPALAGRPRPRRRHPHPRLSRRDRLAVS